MRGKKEQGKNEIQLFVLNSLGHVENLNVSVKTTHSFFITMAHTAAVLH